MPVKYGGKFGFTLNKAFSSVTNAEMPEGLVSAASRIQ